MPAFRTFFQALLLVVTSVAWEEKPVEQAEPANQQQKAERHIERLPMAIACGDFPYWAELEARDLEESKMPDKARYSMMEVATAEIPGIITWYSLPREQSLRFPLRVGSGGYGSLFIVPSTAHCMAESRYTLRILDQEGKVIWKEFRFEAAHQLTKVPPDHQCARLHGHSYKLRVHCPRCRSIRQREARVFALMHR